MGKMQTIWKTGRKSNPTLYLQIRNSDNKLLTLEITADSIVYYKPGSKLVPKPGKVTQKLKPTAHLTIEELQDILEATASADLNYDLTAVDEPRRYRVRVRKAQREILIRERFKLVKQ